MSNLNYYDPLTTIDDKEQNTLGKMQNAFNLNNVCVCNNLLQLFDQISLEENSSILIFGSFFTLKEVLENLKIT